MANRMLSFAYKRFDGRVPEPGELDDEDRALLASVEAGFESVGELPQERLQVPGGAERGAGPAKGANDVRPAKPTATWTARRPGFRSRRTGLWRRRPSTSSCRL
jgi:hypothetical protein